MYRQQTASAVHIPIFMDVGRSCLLMLGCRQRHAIGYSNEVMGYSDKDYSVRRARAFHQLAVAGRHRICAETPQRLVRALYANKPA